MAPAKEFLCKNCGDVHKCPINAKCPFQAKNTDDDDIVNNLPSQSEDANELNIQILAELKSLGGRMTAMEDKIANQEATEKKQPAHQASGGASSSTTPAQLEQMVVPMVSALQGSQQIQSEVDQRIRQLVELNEAGKCKSQRGGNEIVWVKRQVPWPQNFVLGGSNKSRISCDALNWCQWVSGFAAIAREEKNLETKNAMLEYLGEIMEDANDFSWQAAKASHAVLLCRMEEGKVEWNETHKLDRIRRAHAQRGVNQTSGAVGSKPGKSEPKTTACRFYQRGLCHHSKDHETGGYFINTFARLALPWVGKTDIWSRIVGHHPGLQKTTRALPQGSAGCG